MVEQFIGYFFATVLLIMIVLISYQLWFHPEQSKVRIIEIYSKPRKFGCGGFVVWMMEFGIGIWFGRLVLLVMGGLIVSGLIHSLTN